MKIQNSLNKILEPNKLLNNNLYSHGSIENQIIILTQRITKLQKHFTIHPHDYHNKRSLLKIISKRKKYLNYIKIKNYNIYNKLLLHLNLRK